MQHTRHISSGLGLEVGTTRHGGQRNLLTEVRMSCKRQEGVIEVQQAQDV